MKKFPTALVLGVLAFLLLAGALVYLVGNAGGLVIPDTRTETQKTLDSIMAEIRSRI